MTDVKEAVGMKEDWVLTTGALTGQKVELYTKAAVL